MATTPPDLTTVPAAVPPAGWTVDFDSPIDGAKVFYVVGSVGLFLTVFFVLLKFYIRVFIHKEVGFDDALTFVALALQTAHVALVMNMGINGNFRHQWDISVANYMGILKLQSRVGYVQIVALMVSKLAMLALFYRIFSPRAMYKWLIIVTGVVIFVAYMVLEFLFVFLPSATHLTELQNTNNALGVIGVAADVVIAILPISAIFSLNLPMHKKIGVAAVFGTGLIGVAMAILSCYYRFTTTSPENFNDNTYKFSQRAAVQSVEIYITIIVGCVPILPALINKSLITTWLSNTFTSLRRLVSTRDSTTQRSDIKQESYYVYIGDSQQPRSTFSSDSTAPALPLQPIHPDRKEAIVVTRSWSTAMTPTQDSVV